MQCVSEFVEQRIGIVPRDQNRLALFGLYKVRIVGNDRRHWRGHVCLFAFIHAPERLPARA